MEGMLIQVQFLLDTVYKENECYRFFLSDSSFLIKFTSGKTKMYQQRLKVDGAAAII